MPAFRKRLNRTTMTSLPVLLLLVVACLFNSNQVEAHTFGQSYIFTNITESGLNGRLEFPINSLQIAIQQQRPGFILDSTEIDDNQWQVIESYIRRHFKISQGGADYQLEFLDRAALKIEIADYLVVQYTAVAPGPIPDQIDLTFSAIIHAIEGHRLGLVIESNYKTGLKDNHIELSYFFAPGRENFTLNTLGDPWYETLYRFVVEGVVHIWIGIDHVLFIVTLLLMSVVAKAGRDYKAVESLRPAVANTLTLVTIFTVAHTITLYLGLKGWVELPSQIVEPIIALSIVFVALNNIFPFTQSKLLVGLIIFGFGLFHGLGFASVLLELALGPNAKILSLLGFNIGVELGQLVIVLCLFPILFLLRNHKLYNPLVLRGVSAVIAAIGTWWFVSRVFEPFL